MKKLLITYDHFLPAYKAGGPIQSIAHLVRHMHNCLDIYVLTSNMEYGENEVQIPVVPDSWIEFEGGIAKVFYISNSLKSVRKINKIINELNPDLILVNGLYSFFYSLIPVIFFSKKTILHLRGSLHSGALSKKFFKKKVFINIFKLLGLHEKITFCASDFIESDFATKSLGNNIQIKIANNFPALMEQLPALDKVKGKLKLTSIALISPMKNHLIIIQSLEMLKCKVEYDIYGPIKDKTYWELCNLVIKNLPNNIIVNYLGEINPNLIQKTLENYHLFILPSQSENFGHALFEAMISAKPIITSHNTPWNNLVEQKAGFNVDLEPVSIATAIEYFASMSQIEYNGFVSGVRQYAENAIDVEVIKQQYLSMFGLINN